MACRAAARRPKPAKLVTHPALRAYVQDRLAGAVVAPGGAAVAGPAVPWKGRRHGPRQPRRWAKAWSPQQISRRLRLDYPDDEMMQISHEAIYQSLYVQGRGALRRELTACLRTGRALRMPRARSCGRGKSHVGPEVKISERPAEADSTTCGRPAMGIEAKAATACCPSPTRETTLMPGSASSTRARADRTVGLSSQSITRTGSGTGAGGGCAGRVALTRPRPAAARPGRICPAGCPRRRAS